MKEGGEILEFEFDFLLGFEFMLEFVFKLVLDEKMD